MEGNSSVKYFDGNKFYEILFTLKSKVCEAGINADYQNLKTIDVYYRLLKELYIKVRAYIRNKTIKDKLYIQLIDEKDKELYMLHNLSKKKQSRMSQRDLIIRTRQVKKELEKIQIELFEQMVCIELPFKMDFDPSKAIGEGFN